VPHKISIARLKMWPRILAIGPHNLLCLVDLHIRANTAFARNIIVDFKWLAKFADLDHLGDPAANLSAWFEFIASDDQCMPSIWKQQIRVAARKQLAYSQDDRAF